MSQKVCVTKKDRYLETFVRTKDLKGRRPERAGSDDVGSSGSSLL